jgi:hypothetical protein
MKNFIIGLIYVLGPIAVELAIFVLIVWVYNREDR